MKIKFKKITLAICCLTLLLPALTNIAVAEKQQSILDRVQTVDDHELGQLIGIAIANLPESKAANRKISTSIDYSERQKLKFELRQAEEAARSKAIRRVTEVYSQIKLLDTQIVQIDLKIKSLQKTEMIRTELELAKADLNAKRAMKLAELREILNIVPKHAFGRKPVHTLNSWITLDVIDESVYVFDGSKPYRRGITLPDSYKPIKLTSPDGAIKYLKGLIKKPDNFPLRVDIARDVTGSKLSQQLHKKIIQLITDTNMQLEAEVHLEEKIRSGKSGIGWYLWDGKIYFWDQDIKVDTPPDDATPATATHTHTTTPTRKTTARATAPTRKALTAPTQTPATKARAARKASAGRPVSTRRAPSRTIKSRRRPREYQNPYNEKRFFEKTIKAKLTEPRQLPLKFRIRFDDKSKDLALRIEKAVKEIAKELGVEKFVETELIPGFVPRK